MGSGKAVFLLLMSTVVLTSSAFATASGMPTSYTSTDRKITILRSGSTDPNEASVTGGETLPVANPVPPSPPHPANKYLGPKAPEPGLLRKTLPGFPWHKLPNWLTYVRCLAILAMVVLFYLPEQHVATSVLFGCASFTDWLDGYLARLWDITSPFGAFLDPVADKLMVSTSLILLAGRYGKVVAIPSSVILAREIAVSALREWMAQRGQRDSVKVGFQGKVKTALTMVSLTVMLLVPEEATEGVLTKLYQPGLIMLFLSAFVTVTSGSVYFRAAAPVLLGKA